MRTSEEWVTAYTWLTPTEFAEKTHITDKHGKPSGETVRRIILSGASEALSPPRVKDVSRSSYPRYRIHPDAVKMYEAESIARVRERLAS